VLADTTQNAPGIGQGGGFDLLTCAIYLDSPVTFGMCGTRRLPDREQALRISKLARVEAAALRGEVDAANSAWNRLFDIVTALRISELNARRKNADEAERATKLANYTAAREDSLRIRQWARTVATV